MGQITGVGALLTGTVTPFGDSVRLSVKILDTTTAKVIGASSCDIARTKAIEELLAKGIEVPARPTPIPPTKAQQRVQAKDFIFELQACKTGGQGVSCLLTITNKGRDSGLAIFGRDYRGTRGGETKIFDNFGNEYRVSKAQLAHKIMDPHSYVVQSFLVSGVPTAARIDFDGVSQKASMIALFELSLEADTAGNFVVQFRNIPLTR